MIYLIKKFYKIIVKKFEIFTRIINKYILKINNVSINNGIHKQIRGILFLRNYGKLEFGENCRINSQHKANPIGGQVRMSIVVYRDAFLKFGNNVGISNSAIVCKKRIIIGDNVLIGGDCKIYDTDFHSINWNVRAGNDNQVKHSEINIGNNVFIGAGCIILKGVKIGDRSIIGAGSVVSKNVLEDEIWAGNPARFIRKCNIK